MRIPSGKTDILLYFVALDSNDLRTKKTGLSSFTVYRSRNGGTATVYTTPTVVELSASNMPGVYALTIDEDTTIGSSSDSEEYAVYITATGMAPVYRTTELYRRTVTSGNILAINSSGAITAIANGTIAAATFASNALDAVWSTAARLLTAGTNIVLAKGVGVTGFADLDAAGIRTAVGLASADLDTQLDAIATAIDGIDTGGGGGLDAAGVRAAIGMSSANLDTQLGAIDTVVDAVKAKTDNLPSDPADQSLVMDKLDDIELAISEIDSSDSNGGGGTISPSDIRDAIGLSTANLDDQLAAINAKTTNLPSDPASETSATANKGDIMSLVGGVATDVGTARDNTVTIMAKTDNLPSDPADASVIASSFSTVNGTLTTISGYIDTEVAAIKAKTDNLPADPASNTQVATRLASSSYTAPDNSTITSISNRLPAALVSGRIDSHIGSIADAVITAAKFAANALDAVWSTTSRLLTAGTNIVLAKGVGVTGFNDLSTAQVNAEADTALSDAGVTTTVTGRIDAAITTRLASGSYSAPPSAASIRSEMDANSTKLANLDTTITSRLATVAYTAPANSDIAAIKAKTDNLPSDPADQSLIIAAIDGIETGGGGLDAAGVRTAIGLSSPNLDTQLSGINSKTTNLPVAPAAVSDIPSANQNADALLNRTNGVENGWSVKGILRLLAAVAVGKSSGFGSSTVKFRDVNDTVDRVTAAADNGNRTTVTLNGS